MHDFENKEEIMVAVVFLNGSIKQSQAKQGNITTMHSEI